MKALIKYKGYYLFILPGLLYFIIFKYFPMAGILIAFKDISPVMKLSEMVSAPWVGLKHFRNFFSSMFFWNVMRNTLLISLYNIVYGFPAPIIFAILLNEIRQKLFKKTVQTISYLPHFLSMVIVAGMVKNIFSPTGGIVNYFVTLSGNEPIMFLTNNSYIRSILVGTAIWQGAGWGSIIYLAAITGISEELYEAATIDGAGRFQKMRYITLPSITFTISIMFILQCGSILDAGFERVLLLQNNITLRTTDIIDTYVYRVGLIDVRYSFSTAVNLFKSVIALFMVSMVNWITKKMGQEGLW